MWSDASKRYKTPIADIYSSENKLKLQLLVESRLSKIQAQLGIINEEEANLIESGIHKVQLARTKEIEDEIHHDVMAVVKALAEQSGTAGGKVHLGATSSDLQDTVLALQLLESRKLLLDLLDKLSETIANLAHKNKNLVCIGRTHGQFAIPTTVGFKFANYLYELQFTKDEFINVPINLSKFSGAIGNYASTMRLDIENDLLHDLGLEPVPISTQVVTRLIHAKYMNSLALCAAVIERLSKEIRNLQRSEIMEWFEPFTSKQVGSSAMPHKRNPHKSERISGLSRIIRGNVSIALENIALEHERDLSHSSVERIIIPESSNLLYYIAESLLNILNNLTIEEKYIKRNLKQAMGVSKSEQILKQLIPKIGHQKGHELLRKHANSGNFKSSILNDDRIRNYISKEHLKKIFQEENIGLADIKTEQILTQYNDIWKNYRNN